MNGGTPTIPDPETVSRTHGDVMGLYDSVAGVPTFVLADLTAEDRWVSVPTGAAVSLDDWR
jgi:hypothetical protein